MIASKVVLRTSRVLLLDTDGTDTIESPSYQLKWRFNKLWVCAVTEQPINDLPALSNTQWLKECLGHSPIDAVCLDLNIGEQAIQRWADTCEAVRKPVFLRLPHAQTLPKSRKPRIWKIKRVFDWLVAVVLLIGLSPILLILATLTWCFSPNAVIKKEWAVGCRGRLFRLYKFNVANSDNQHSVLCSWIQRCGLDKLPQLVHVVHGDISLVGPRPHTLTDIKQYETRQILSCLKALPGMTGAKQITSKLYLHSNSEAEPIELQYLKNWSLKQDIRFFLLAIPKVLLGFNTY